MVRWGALLLLLSSIGVAQERGLIRGTVLDETGVPVVNAYVAVDAMSEGKISSTLNAYSDGSGQFVFDGLALGEYRVSAQKEDEGYLTTRPNVFEHNPPLIVKLTADVPAGTATVHFSARGAVLTGRVRDAKTGAPVAAQFTLKPENGNGLLGTGTNGRDKFTLSVPANAGFTLEVSAEGYKAWLYSDATHPEQAAILRLEPGSKKELNIDLDPLPGE
jgi:Carboxypeptidase regulatory-like domain